MFSEPPPEEPDDDAFEELLTELSSVQKALRPISPLVFGGLKNTVTVLSALVAWFITPSMGRVGAVATLGLGGYFARTAQLERRPLAVVTAEEVTLRSGRDIDSVDLAKLHAGAELAVVSRDAPWVQVRLGGDVRGWVPDASVALVRPTSLQ